MASGLESNRFKSTSLTKVNHNLKLSSIWKYILPEDYSQAEDRHEQDHQDQEPLLAYEMNKVPIANSKAVEAEAEHFAELRARAANIDIPAEDLIDGQNFRDLTLFEKKSGECLAWLGWADDFSAN